MRSRLISSGEAAAICGVDIRTIRRWTDAGLLMALRTPGGHRRYWRTDVQKLMQPS